jgi:hypothetical protein
LESSAKNWSWLNDIIIDFFPNLAFFDKMGMYWRVGEEETRVSAKHLCAGSIPARASMSQLRDKTVILST